MGEIEQCEWDSATQLIVNSIRTSAIKADGKDPLDEAAALRLQHHGLTNARLWLADDLGFAYVYDGALDLAVSPTARGQGIGTQLAALAAPLTNTAWSHGDHPAAYVLARKHGFTRTRELWVMRRPAAQAAASNSETTAVIRGYRPTDQAELLRVNAAAFAEHPEQGGMDATNLSHRMAAGWFDPAGLLVAMERTDDGAHESNRMLGFHWTKRHSSHLGEVYVVAIDPPAHGRGLGKALTAAGLRHLANVLAPDAEVMLYVESDNHPARAVYEGLGFTHVRRDTHVQYAAH